MILFYIILWIFSILAIINPVEDIKIGDELNKLEKEYPFHLEN